MIRLVGPRGEAEERKAPARGEIVGFSWRSRMRLLRQLACIDQSKVESGLFVTLTYPGVFSLNPAEWKRDLDAFVKRLRREHPEAAGWWKLEPQRRGAPHFHLLLFGVGGLDLAALQGWVSGAWYEVVDSGDVRHLHAGTRVERVRTWAGVMAYAGKYLGKTGMPHGMGLELESVWRCVGRWWGSFGREHLPTAAVEVGLWQEEFDQLREWVLALQDEAAAKRREEAAERGVELPHRTNWLRFKPDVGASCFMAWERVRDLVKRVTGVDLAEVESREAAAGEFSC